jgi:hypothetical protein
MRDRIRRAINVATAVLVTGAALVLAPVPAEAELATAVHRTDGVEGRFTGPTSNVVPAHVWDIEVIGNTVYVAGKFLDVVQTTGSWPRVDQPFLAAFDATSGSWIDWWRPQLDAPVWALDESATGSLIAAGEFTTVNGQPRQNLVALDARTGEIDPSFYAEVERAWTTQMSVVRDVSVAGNNLYLIGNFNHVTGGPGALRTPVYKAARVDLTTGAPDTAWKPVIAGRSGWGIVESADGARVHLGGEFSYVNSEPDSSLLATVDSVTGASVPGWDGGSNAPFASFWPEGGIVYDLDVHGNNLFVGGAEHFWEMRDSLNGDSLKYQQVSNDTQNVEVIGDRVYIGCHCDGLRRWSPGHQVWEIDATNGDVLPAITPSLRSGDGGWASQKAPDGCLWIGGDFWGSTEVVGKSPGTHWVGRIARLCDAAGPQPHNVPSLLPPGAENKLIAEGHGWSHLVDGTHPSGWTTAGFDDTAWSAGPSELGFGDGDEATVIPATAGGQPVASALFRTEVQIDDPGAVPFLELGLNVDDGATVWVNGVPVVAENMPSGQIAAGTLASSAVWGTSERDFSDYRIPATMLTAGLNTIAVSVHQSWLGSRDLTFDLRLVVGEGPPGALEPQPAITVPGTPPPDAVDLVAEGADWSYLDDGSDQGSGWTAPAFDDSAWAVGPAQLGYGDGDEATVISEGRVGGGPRAVTSYFRHSFQVDDATAFSELLVGLLRDDGAAVHLNGSELMRDNLPFGPLATNTLASGYSWGADESTHHQFVIPSTLLQTGLNVLAVEVHSADRGSADISFGLSLAAR